MLSAPRFPVAVSIQNRIFVVIVWSDETEKSYMLVMKRRRIFKDPPPVKNVVFSSLHPLKCLTWNVLTCIGPMCFHIPLLTGTTSVQVLKVKCGTSQTRMILWDVSQPLLRLLLLLIVSKTSLSVMADGLCQSGSQQNIVLWQDEHSFIYLFNLNQRS